MCLEPGLCNKRVYRSEKPASQSWRAAPAGLCNKRVYRSEKPASHSWRAAPAGLCNKRVYRNEKPASHSWRAAPAGRNWRKVCVVTDPAQPINKFKKLYIFKKSAWKLPWWSSG